MKLLIVHNFYTDLTGEDLGVRETVELLRNSGRIEVIEYYKYSADFPRLPLLQKAAALLKGNIPFRVPRDFKELLDREKPDVAQITNLTPLINVWILKEMRKRNIPVACFVYNYRVFCPRGTCFLRNGFCEKCFTKSLFFCLYHNCLGRLSYSLLYAYGVLLQRLLLTYIDVFITETNFAKDFYGRRLAKKDIVSIRGQAHIPEELKNTVEKKEDFVIFSGRHVKEKGLLTVLEAAALLKDIKFKIYGEGPLTDYSRCFARRRGLKNVEFAGLAKRQELLRQVAASRSLISASGCNETCNRAILESLSLGTPVVASRIGVIPETVKDEINGLLYEAGNAVDLARQIKRIFEDSLLYENLCRNARGSVWWNTPENCLQGLLSAYGNLLTLKAARRPA